MKTIILGLAMAIGIAAAAVAGDVIDMRHPSLRHPKGAAVYCWCLKRAEIPAEYEGHSILPTPLSVGDSGVIIVNQLDMGIFLTSEECLDQTTKAIEAFGVDPNSLIFTKK